MIDFCTFLKNKRTELGLSLRKFCLDNDIDPSNYSKIERGIIKPPAEPQLKKIAQALDIDLKSGDWIQMQDLAHVARHTLPSDLFDDNDKSRHFPLFFRCIRGEQLSDEEMGELLKIIKNS